MPDLPPALKVVRHDLGVDTESAYIIPLSDLHIGASFDERKFLGYRQWILDRPNAYCVINGDIVDNSIKESIGDTYGTLRPAEQIEKAEELLRPLAENGKILAYVDGNHEYRTAHRTDELIGKTICKFLGIRDVYDPDGAYLFITIGHDHHKGSPQKNRVTYTFFQLHGHSGGRKVGGKANALAAMAESVTADCYIASHTHTPLVFPGRVVVPQSRTKSLVYQKQLFVSAGSFAEWEGYAIRKNFSPAPLGSPRIRLDGTRKDIHCSV